jgi:hypothetical protein
MFRTFVSRPQKVYVPDVYEKAIRYIYGGLDDTRTLLASSGASYPQQPTEMSVKVFDFAGVARFAVPVAGPDFIELFEREQQLLAGRDVKVMQVWLGLSSPQAAEAVEMLRRRGYFFGGIFPRWFDWDGVMMQRIIGQPEWNSIHLYSKRAEQILAYIYDDWQSVRQNAETLDEA